MLQYTKYLIILKANELQSPYLNTLARRFAIFRHIGVVGDLYMAGVYTSWVGEEAWIDGLSVIVACTSWNAARCGGVGCGEL